MFSDVRGPPIAISIYEQLISLAIQVRHQKLYMYVKSAWVEAPPHSNIGNSREESFREPKTSHQTESSVLMGLY